MTEKNITIKDEYIKLGQALKLADIASEGVEAKYMILDEKVKVNGEVCTQRGKKLYKGDEFETEGIKVKVQ
ncbi:MAG: RNA-binding S4 domain-containing protein [Lachnospiraceae bacterium]|nr:RNA-binding S4 domain-containing protein [Lachnospiraceae bacterium]